MLRASIRASALLAMNASTWGAKWMRRVLATDKLPPGYHPIEGLSYGRTGQEARWRFAQGLDAVYVFRDL